MSRPRKTKANPSYFESPSAYEGLFFVRCGEHTSIIDALTNTAVMENRNKSSVSLILIFLPLIFLAGQVGGGTFAFGHEPNLANTPSHLLDSSRTEESVSRQRVKQEDENTPVIEYFTASPSSIYIGMDVELIWGVKNATVIGIAPGIGRVSPISSVSVRPAETTTYVLTALNNSKLIKQEVTVKVSPSPPLPPPPPPPSRLNGARSTITSRQRVFRKGEKAVFRPAFASNSAILPRSAYGDLTEFADKLLQSPEAIIEISGHTDAGQYRQDSQLSLMRAKAVRDFLNQKGVPTDQMKVRDAGSDEPVTRKKTKRARAMNNRVEIKITQLTERN